MLNKDIFISVILPVCRPTRDLASYVSKVNAEITRFYENFEIVIVDDGKDRGLRDVFKQELTHLAGLRYLRLSRPAGLEIAINAGFESVIGDICIVLVPQIDPVENLKKMIDLCERSGRVVIGRRTPAAPTVYGVLKSIFYFFSRRLLKIPLVENATYCIAIHRTALNSVLQIREKIRFFTLFVGQIGFEYEVFDYQWINNPGISYGRGIMASIAFAVDVIVGNSLRPLRIASLLALLAMGVNVFYVAYVFTIVAVRHHWTEGWVTLSLGIAINAAILSGAAMIGLEYVRRLVLEAKDRPLYFVTEDLQSPLLSEKIRRLNVVSESDVKKASS